MTRFTKSILVLVLMLAAGEFLAQDIFSNKKKMDSSRFGEYASRPFYFDENLNAEIYLKGNDEPYQVDEANFNLLTGSIEIFKSGYYVELDRKKVRKVIFNMDGYRINWISIPNTEETAIFKLYRSEQYMLIDKVRTKIAERSYNTPGKIVEMNYIRDYHNFVLTADGDPKDVRIKKKDIIKVLGDRAKEIISRTDNKLKDVWDLMQLLKDLDSA